jgi:alpha-L-fucosidase
VERFDVPLLVQQCVDAGAGWLLFTISHAQQHLPFPSPTLDRVIVGRTCERDLVAEIAAALAVHGIRLILYYPNVADDSDPDWQRASGWLYDPKSYAALQYDLVAEIGERYGPRVAGWWLDNCYDPVHKYPRWHHLHVSAVAHADLYDFARYAEALRAGNPDRAVTFNYSGTDAWRSVLGTGLVDYGAGESNLLDRVPSGPDAGEGGSQWHSFVWMDEFWVHSKPGEVPLPRYATEQVVAYIEYVRKFGGGFSYNAAPYQDELVAEATMAQLREIRQALRGT